MRGAAPTPEVNMSNTTVSNSHTANETAMSSHPMMRGTSCVMQEQTTPTINASTGVQTTSKVRARLVMMGADQTLEADQIETRPSNVANQRHRDGAGAGRYDAIERVLMPLSVG